MRSFFQKTALILFLLIAVYASASAQCAMCKGAAETALKQGGGDPQGLNNGILYMLAMPYLLVGAIGFWWWKNRRNENDSPIAEMFDEEE
jgi:hypothetical protein